MKALRAFLITALPLAVGACGFQPLYGTDAAGPAANHVFTTTYVEPVADHIGYELRNTLIDLLNTSDSPPQIAYRLKVTVSETRRGIALQNDATITRYNYIVGADYVLTDAAGHVITSGHESSLSAYNVASSPYATLVGQQDAEKEAADDLASHIRLDLAVYFARHSGHPS
jgi:LPS-assembly lipoprotein